MNYIDIIILVPLLWGAYKGFTKGFIIEMASLASLILGVFGAIKFSGFVSELMTKYMNVTTEYLPVIAFAITFIGIVIAVYFLARMMDKFVKNASLGIANKLVGATFGILKFGIIIGVLIFVINRFDKEEKVISPNLKQKSLLYQPMSSFVEYMFPTIQELNSKFQKELSTTEPVKTSQ